MRGQSTTEAWPEIFGDLPKFTSSERAYIVHLAHIPAENVYRESKLDGVYYVKAVLGTRFKS